MASHKNQPDTSQRPGWPLASNKLS
jgi:hypothetical protein